MQFLDVYSKHCQILQPMMVWKRFFLTGTGLMGFGNARIEVGDEIWVLGGSNRVFVLRRAVLPRAKVDELWKQGLYRIVSLDYVEGCIRVVNKPASRPAAKSRLAWCFVGPAAGRLA
jgi:hypothetical protein